MEEKGEEKRRAGKCWTVELMMMMIIILGGPTSYLIYQIKWSVTPRKA
jgi:hypothetical protein